MQEKKKGLPASALKWIAVVSMFIDHAAAVFFLTWYWPLRRQAGIYPAITTAGRWSYYVFRGIGRFAFPIYCFLLVEGFLHTRNVKKYMLRLFLFGLVSELPYDRAFDVMWFQWDSQNVFFTLFLGLLAIWLTDRLTRGRNDGALRRMWLRIPGAAAVIFGCMWLADWAKTDYSWCGVAVIVLMYLLRRWEIPRFLGSGLALLPTGQTLAVFGRSLLERHPTVGFSGRIEMVGLPVFLLFHFYNGERGRQAKYFFYLFYPVHLALLCLIRYLAVGI